MTKPKKVLTIIEQLGFGKEKDFRPFTKSEIEARKTHHDDEWLEEQDHRAEINYARNCGKPF